jgi:hypothetical protein
MRTLGLCSILSVLLPASAAVATPQSIPQSTPPTMSQSPQTLPHSAPESDVDSSGVGDYCIGGKYESDSDINGER